MIQELLKEYSLEIDDVHWYLSHQLKDIIQSMLLENPESLVKYIWSGQLEAELYNRAERYLHQLEDNYQRGLQDESYLRDFMNEILALKKKRQ